MVAIRTIGDIREKWERVTPGRAEDYRKGIEAPLRDWETQTAAAESAYEEGVTAAIGEKRFGKGVKKVGTEKWRRRAEAVGVRRWPEGVRIAAPDYEQGFAPFRDVIERITLPPRFPKGDPRNLERVAAIAKALQEKKVG